MRRPSFQAWPEKRKDGLKWKTFLEWLYGLPSGKIHGQDSPFVRAARTKNEKMEQLNEGLTEEQKEQLEAYLDADGKIEGMIHFDRFRFAFHLGAQLMAELIEGREEML